MNVEQLSTVLTAAASPQRMLIVAELAGGEVHISELARRVNMSRALLYMHLAKLEAAGFVTTRLTLAEEGTALKLVALQPFSYVLDADAVVSAVQRSGGK